MLTGHQSQAQVRVSVKVRVRVGVDVRVKVGFGARAGAGTITITPLHPKSTPTALRNRSCSRPTATAMMTVRIGTRGM